MKFATYTIGLFLLCAAAWADPLLHWASDNAAGGGGRVHDSGDVPLAQNSHFLVELIDADTDTVLYATNEGFSTGAGQLFLSPDASDSWNGRNVKTRIYNSSTKAIALEYADFSGVEALTWSTEPAAPGTVLYNAGAVVASQWEYLTDLELEQFTTHQDVGGVGIAGASSYSDGVYTVTASGADIWGSSDQFFFASDLHQGDGAIIARVDSIGNTNGWAKAGVMFRASVNADSAFVMVARRPDGTIVMQWRKVDGGGTTWGGGLAGDGTASWVKLVREDDAFTGYFSYDGETWTSITQTSVVMPASIFAGLAVTSHHNGQLTTAEFSEVSTSSVLGGLFTNAIDLGATTLEGGFSYDNDVYSLDSAGTQIGGGVDSCFFASQLREGDAEVLAKVDALENTSLSAKAGLMFRETLEIDSANVGLWVQADNTVTLGFRDAVTGQYSATTLVAGSSVLWLKLVREGEQYSGYYSLDGATWVLVAQVSNSLADLLEVGLVVASNNPSVLCTADFSEVAITTNNNGIFTSAINIGTPALSGSFAYHLGTYEIEGGGNDISGGSDNFFFASQLRDGDSEIVARVDRVENTDTWAKAGIMYRETLDANSKNVALVVRPDGAIHLQTRSSTGGGTGSSSVGMVTPETWIKLVRSGNNFDAYYSGDGVTWTYITTKTISMAAQVEVGLAVTSHKDSVLCTAIFSNVNVQ